MYKIIFVFISIFIIIFYPTISNSRNLLEFKLFFERNNVLIYTDHGLIAYQTIKHKDLTLYTRAKIFYNKDVSTYKFLTDEKYIPSDFVYGFIYDFTDNIEMISINGNWKDQYFIILKIKFDF